MLYKKYWKMKKASLTAEAAMVLPLVLISVIVVLSVCFFVHNRAWLTAAACESALCGSMEGEKGEEAAEAAAASRGETLVSEPLIGAGYPEMSVSVSNEIVVEYQLSVRAYGTGYLLSSSPVGKAFLLKASERLRSHLAETETGE